MRASPDRLLTWLVSERWRVMLAAVVATLLVAAAKVSAAMTLLDDPWEHEELLITDALLSGAFAGTLVGILLNMIRGRRRRLIEYVRRVADLNHHVRNALQVIVYQASLRTADKSEVEQIETVVRRVDAALHEIFPILGGDRKTDVSKRPRKHGSHDLIH
jgi:hypothetical protein